MRRNVRNVLLLITLMSTAVIQLQQFIQAITLIMPGSHQSVESIHETPQEDPVRIPKAPAPIRVFYNIFVQDKGWLEFVAKIAKEQMANMIPGWHQLLVTSIGYDIRNSSMMEALPNNTKVLSYHKSGDEKLTLHYIWEYCQNVSDAEAHDTKVVYLHPKGSFHNTTENTGMRQATTVAALSRECANLPDTCNVCSHRFSPVPFPHTSGNMWLARCSYIKTLVKPNKFESKINVLFRRHRGHNCKGKRRLAQEHYIHHGPEVQPCDLMNESWYTWNYDDRLSAKFERNLQPAPRFNYTSYIKHWCTDSGIDVRQFLEVTNYIYEKIPPQAWYGWSWYPNATALAKEFVDSKFSRDNKFF